MAATNLDYGLLATFVAVADERSFSRAAVRLGLTKSTVSRAIAQLEEHLGLELLHRTTHKVALSTAGTALYERTAPHLAALRQSVVLLPESAEQPSGVLRITAPHDLGVIVLPPLLAQFSLRYPAVRLDVRLANARIDLVAGGFDLALRASAHKLDDSGLSVRRIGPVAIRYYAAPAYVARRGEPRSFGDETHEWVDFPGSEKALGRVPKSYRPRFRSDDFFFIRDLLREGVGIGPLPSTVAEDYVRAGMLVPVLPRTEWKGAGGLFLVYPSSGQVTRKVIAFRDFLLDWLKMRPLVGTRA